MTEHDIVYENGAFWVCRTGAAYVVYRAGLTHSTSDSGYPLDADGRSLAIARADYLARRARDAAVCRIDIPAKQAEGMDSTWGNL